ncbi:MAG: TlpA family protein disulfide reductase [Solirubrobacteraceae bacterium]
MKATWILGVVVVCVLAYVTVNTLRTDANGSRGVAVGGRVPPFAAPLALANVRCGGEECDANVLLKSREGVPKACDARGPNILNACQLTERRPLVLAFLVAPSQRCIDQIDVLERVMPRFPGVAFAAVAIRGDHRDLNAIIRRHGWTLPVGYDHDGAVANAFAVAICPTVTFVRRGGRVARTTLGGVSEAEMVRDVRALLR